MCSGALTTERPDGALLVPKRHPVTMRFAAVIVLVLLGSGCTKYRSVVIAGAGSVLTAEPLRLTFDGPMDLSARSRLTWEKAVAGVGGRIVRASADTVWITLNEYATADLRWHPLEFADDRDNVVGIPRGQVAHAAIREVTRTGGILFALGLATVVVLIITGASFPIGGGQ